MRIVSALIAGVRGAENGTADIYKKGTSVRATIYSDIDGSVHSDNGSQLSLDSNGSIEVYVNEYVDIVVKDSDGTTVHEWTEGDTANNVEYRGQSFTGTDPDDGSTGVGSSYPVNLQDILDLWYTNGGGSSAVSGSGIDWKITIGSTTSTLPTWLGPLAGGFLYNVQDATYGATGDGSTDDTTAVAAAITAANAAGGGIVFFPAGTYRLTSALTMSTGVSLMGAGPSVSILTMDHATNGLLLASPAAYTKGFVMGLQFTAAQSNTGKLIDITSGFPELLIDNCYFGGANCDGATLIDDGSAAQRVIIRNCYFSIGDSAQDAITCTAHTGATGRWLIENCVFSPPAAYSAADAIIYGNNMDVRDCLFITSSTTSGTYTCIKFDSTTLDGSVIGCRFETSGGATVTGIDIGTYITGSEFMEAGQLCPNQADTNFTLYAGLFSGASGGENVQLRTRATRTYYVSNDDATLSVSSLQYGTVLWNKSGTTNITGFGPAASNETPPGHTTVWWIYAGGGTIASVAANASVSGETLGAITSTNFGSITAVGTPAGAFHVTAESWNV